MVNLTSADFDAMERELCSRSFAEYMQRAWPVLEPAQPYIDNWHAHCIGEHLEACSRGEINRLLFNVPPGTSKSTSVAVMYPTWLWGPAGQPSHRFIGASHEAGLATRDNRKCRNIIESEWYNNLWDVNIVSDQNEKTFFENESTGFRQSVAVKSMTGRRGDTVVWDDPLSPEKAYSDLERDTAIRVFRETLPSRLTNPNESVVIVMMQRLHQNDVSGHILEGDYGYTHVCLPMEYEPNRFFTVVCPKYMEPEKLTARYHKESLRWFVEGETIPQQYEDKEHDIMLQEPQEVYRGDPRTVEGELIFEERFSRATVDRDKRIMGDFAVAGQFQQRPTPRGGGMFPVERMKTLDAAVSEYHVKARIRYWDKAGTSDGGAYTAGVLMCALNDGSMVVEHVARRQVAARDREAMIKDYSNNDPAGTITWIEQEPGSGGKESAELTVANLAGKQVYIDRVTGDKIFRAAPYSSQVQANNVAMVRGVWNQAFKDEHESFPNGKYKDQVDAAAGAYMKLVGPGKVAGVLF